MSSFIKWSIRERKVVVLVSVFVMLFGFYSYYYMPRQEFPDTASPAVQIVTIFPGASAETVREQVTKKVEDEVARLDGVDILKSYSQDNSSVVFAILGDGVDYDKQWVKLKDNLAKLRKDLPDSVISVDVNHDVTETAEIIISLSSDEFDNQRLSDFAKDYKEKLSAVDGINYVEVVGEKKTRLSIELYNEKLRETKLSIDDVYNIIRAQSVVIPSGSIETEDGKINVVVPESFRSVEDFKNTVINISEETGDVLLLSDIAKVEMSEVKNDTYYIKDNRAAVLLTAYFDENKNIVLIGEEVKREIDNLRKIYPEELIIDEVIFLPEDVANSVDSFIWNLLEGILFVVLVIFFGMGMRNALIVSVAIPLSIAMTFSSMGVLDVELQQVSIAALIIALGILVDNAIVIIDAIQMNVNEGMEMPKAAFLGAREQAIPVLTSTLTTIAAFSPLIALPGTAGEFTSSLPLIVIVALTASYVVAMIVAPALGSRFIKERTRKRDLLKPLHRFYSKIMHFNLKNPAISMFIVVLCLGMTVYAGYKYVGIKMFPYVDKNWFYVDISSEIIGDIDDTEKLVLKADKLLREYPEVTETTSAVGGGVPRYYMMAPFVNPSEDRGMILAKFDLSKSDRFHKREELVYDIQKKFDAEFIGGYGTAKLLEINIPGANVEVRVAGLNYNDISKVSDLIYDKLLADDRTINVQQNKPYYRYRYRVDVDDKKALMLGLTKYDIQRQLNMSLNGAKVGAFSRADTSHDIFLSSNLRSISDVEKLELKSSVTGNKIALKQLASVRLEEELGGIFRYDRKPVIMVTSDVRPGYGVGAVSSDIIQFISEAKTGVHREDFDSVSISYGGDKETMALYLKGLFTAAVLAVVLIYLILLVQFNSLVQPIIIMITVPLSFMGIVLALIITGTNFTFTVGLGAASLMGIVVNNGILLIEYINRARKDGLSVKEACIQSVDKRIRPILMSSVTTIFGLIPLALSNSTFFTPMSIALIGGLVVATFTTISVVPTIYYIFSGKDRA